MTFRIRRGDENLGSASLEELRARRESGSLTGSERVQGGDSPDWVLLDSLLNPAEPPLLPAPPTPPLLSRPVGKRRISPILILILIVVVLALGSAGTAYLVRQHLQSRVTVAKTGPGDAPGLAAASKPIHVSATPTVRDVQKRRRAFEIRQCLDAYQQRSLHLPKADAANEEFIRVGIDKDHGGPEEDSPLKLDEDCLRIAQDAAENDPLILTLAARHTLNWYRRVELYKRALALYPASQHRAYPAFFADVRLMNESEHEYDVEGELNTTALKRLAQCFTDGSFQPSDQQEIAALFIDDYAGTFFERNDQEVCEIVHQAGPAYLWLSLIMDARRLITEAWKARGGGSSNTVSAQGFDAFNQDLNQALLILTKAWQLKPDYPVAASLGVYAALNHDSDTMRVWFDRAVAAQIDSPAAWNNMR
jgi:hypothetical protein